jgi:hypothetical protein
LPTKKKHPVKYSKPFQFKVEGSIELANTKWTKEAFVGNATHGHTSASPAASLRKAIATAAGVRLNQTFILSVTAKTRRRLFEANMNIGMLVVVYWIGVFRQAESSELVARVAHGDFVAPLATAMGVTSEDVVLSSPKAIKFEAVQEEEADEARRKKRLLAQVHNHFWYSLAGIFGSLLVCFAITHPTVWQKKGEDVGSDEDDDDTDTDEEDGALAEEKTPLNTPKGGVAAKGGTSASAAAAATPAPGTPQNALHGKKPGDAQV